MGHNISIKIKGYSQDQIENLLNKYQIPLKMVMNDYYVKDIFKTGIKPIPKS